MAGSRYDAIRELAALHGQPNLSPDAMKDIRTRVDNHYIDNILDDVPVQTPQEQKDTGAR